MTETRQVQVPRSYFEKARSEYADWRWAVIREFIQNSYDAQATQIDFRLTGNAAGRVELQVDDDGVGMDQDTLLNVLLCMGGSKKPDGSIGGFGYAKAILFFAHHSYSIRTGSLRIDGSGGEYRLTVKPANIIGTQIMVELGDEAVLLDAWRERIKIYVASCFMEYATGRPVTISLDEQALPQNNDGTYSFAVQTPLGSMWYDEVPDSSRSAFVVSVAGLPMFVESFYSDANQSALSGGLELEAGSAVLTANRDGFTSAVREQFSKVVGGLVQNQSAVRYGQALDLAINFDCGARSPAENPSAVADSESSVESSTPLLLVCQEAEPDALAGYAAALGRITHERYPSNFHLKIESLSVRRSATSRAYITAPVLVAAMNKQRSAKLAHSWLAALMTILCCDWALANGVEFYDGQGMLIDDWECNGSVVADSQAYFRGRRVDAGFCFIANTGGLCSTPVGDQSHRIYINPLLLTAEAAFRAGDTLDLAYHEAAHLWEQHHGEAFCGVEGKLRQSIRRWLSEREVLSRMVSAVQNC
ncbi:MAG: ATP-binding protein [Rhodocyclales bacterium]|nr:ATP-binding protein [Rhodocyclales bacterium]